jgi:hypothetical protein
MLIENNANWNVKDYKGESVWFYLCTLNSSNIHSYRSEWYHKFIVYNQIEAIKWYFEVYKQNQISCNNYFELIELAKALTDFYERCRSSCKLVYCNEEENKLKGQLDKFFLDFHKRFLEKFAEKNELLNELNFENQTILIRAIQCRSDKWIIELLINKGANLSHRDNIGKTALHYAIEENLTEIAELLMNKGLNVNDKTIAEPYLITVFKSNTYQTRILKMLIQHGINLHGKYYGKSFFKVFSQECYSSKNCFFFFKNALVNELIDTFKYTDYEKFKQRVVESIDNDDVILIDSDHLEALESVSMDEKETFEYLKSFEFKERFIVDYLNFLEDLKERLEMKRRKLNQSYPEIAEIIEQIKVKEDNFNQYPYRVINNSLKQECFYKFKNLISEEESVQNVYFYFLL